MAIHTSCTVQVYFLLSTSPTLWPHIYLLPIGKINKTHGTYSANLYRRSLHTEELSNRYALNHPTSECPVYQLVLLEPSQAICCGYSFCRVCIGHIKAEGDPCPCCKADEDLTTTPTRVYSSHFMSSKFTVLRRMHEATS